MSQGAGFALVFTIVAMALFFMLGEKLLMHGPVWFPYYFFVTVFSFCAGTIYFYGKA